MARKPASPTVRRLKLGQELRLLRERNNLTGTMVARRLGWSPSKVSRIESSKTMPSAADIEALARVFSADDDKLEELLSLLRDADQRGWWEDYEGSLPEETITLFGLEAEAIAHRSWEPQVVSGLLQTDDYARGVIEASRAISRITQTGVRKRVEARLDRQQYVLHRPEPPEMIVVMDESVLLRRIGDPAVMREQLGHLLEVSVLPHVSIQVLPLDGEHPINTGGFIHLSFADLDDALYLESLYGGRIVEDLELVADYELAFEQLRSAALSEDESRILIQRRLMQWR
ncbi:helix-turn-helix domain-containing protein [Thermoactinospora rubra]|uniref:helix-turn-helix domain-containing protein n=1 Tax=Thermoactinospora rubra TaxID=1088767 RepID=UPI000A117ED8|nr:helix-turn-helix transcriptional regulator [Thermoactinospora rubra]